MKARRHRNANRFILTWIFYGFVVYALAGVAVGIAGFATVMLLNVIGLRDSIGGNDLIESALMGVVGGAIGWAIGYLQTRALHDQLRWSADNWTRFSIIGGIVGGILVGVVADTSQSNVDGLENTQIRQMMVLFIGAVSVFQWWALREAVKNASVWIVTNLVAAFVFGSLVTQNVAYGNVGYGSDYRELMQLAGYLLAPLMQAFLTGTVMLMLFERFAYPIERYGKRDTVIPKKSPAEKSIWDKAI